MNNKRFVADENMPFVEQLFGQYGDVKRLPGRAITAADVADADALLVRSVTRVDQALLDKADRLAFVGTATIGMDHLDCDHLQQQSIRFSNAAGCNAAAVGDYVLSVIASMYAFMDKPLTEMTVGVVGVGNIGTPLVGRLEALGFRVICCDPPRVEAEQISEFIPLDELLQRADIITFHVPLTQKGEHPTYHLLNAQRLERLPAGKLIINAARGEVVDNQALKVRLLQKKDLLIALDVWENEPTPDPELVTLVDLATPHIAGYSYEGKVRGTSMIFDRWRGDGEVTDITTLIEPPSLAQIAVRLPFTTELMLKLIHTVYNVTQDHRTMLAVSGQKNYFDRLRKEYPLRREIGSTQIKLLNIDVRIEKMIKQLGFISQVAGENK